MRCSITPREKEYVKGYGFLSLTRNLLVKYHKKLIHTASRSSLDAAKTVNKTAEVTRKLIGSEIAEKIVK